LENVANPNIFTLYYMATYFVYAFIFPTYIVI